MSLEKSKGYESVSRKSRSKHEKITALTRSFVQGPSSQQLLSLFSEPSRNFCLTQDRRVKRTDHFRPIGFLYFQVSLHHKTRLLLGVQVFHVRGWRVEFLRETAVTVWVRVGNGYHGGAPVKYGEGVRRMSVTSVAVRQVRPSLGIIQVKNRRAERT